MKQNKYQIISFKKIHIPEIRNLYYKAYNRKKPLKVFKYKLDNTPYGKPITFLMKYEKSIVGFYTIVPIVIKIKDKKILGGMSFLTMTHPEHQRKGIFSKLAKKTYSTAKKKGYKFILSFSVNKNSILGFKKLGFVSKSIYYSQISLKNKLTGKYLSSVENKFPKKIGKLWNEFENRKYYKIQPDKNEKFIQWRYEKNPTTYFTIFKKGKYFIILKKFDNILHIVDFFGNINNLNEIVVKSAIQEGKRLQCDQITTWWPKSHQNKKIKNITFKKIRSQNYFVIKKLDKNLTSDILELKNWYFTMAESDVF